MATQYAGSVVVSGHGAEMAGGKRYLHGPVVDFLCFGGLTLIVFPVLMLLPAAASQARVALVMTVLSYFINYPHFAHSYQIFYRGFARKAFSSALGRELQARYVFAGLVVPAILVSVFAWCVAASDLRLLAYCANAMGLFVGWHYVKQGYGLLMVDCSLKRQFFDAGEKKALLINSYAVWALAWELVNASASKDELWGITYYALPIPGPIVDATAALVLVTTAAVVRIMVKRWRKEGTLPVSGVAAYMISLYAWLIAGQANALWLLVIPALHSLQYLAVVWRFQARYEAEHLADSGYKSASLVRRAFGGNPKGHMAAFVLSGIALGVFGFVIAPGLFTTFVDYDRTIFGRTMFVFIAWIFINVHHYFMDNVMWRRDNPDVKRYLFS